MNRRPEWEEYLMLMAFSASLRSEDPHRKVGCVCADKDHQVLATGYNGLLPGKLVEESYWNSDLRLKTVFHAEQNGLLRTDPKAVHTLIVTTMSCLECLKLAACHGVKEIVYCVDYPRSPESIQLARDFYNIQVRQIQFARVKELMTESLNFTNI